MVNRIGMRLYSRAIIAIMLVTVWGLVAISGLVLYLAPSGQRSGRQLLLLGLTKTEWSNAHFWIAVATFLITVIHIIIDWKAFIGVLRYLMSAHRTSKVFIEK
jgi:hypothetical protein